MKKMIIVLLTLASFSIFANDECTLVAKNAVVALANSNKSTTKVISTRKYSTNIILNSKVTTYLVETEEGTSFKVKTAIGDNDKCIALAVGFQGYLDNEQSL